MKPYKEKYLRSQEELERLRSRFEDTANEKGEKLKATEVKLRKYVKHCQNLEAEKGEIAATLEEFHPSISVKKEGLANAVVSLCENFQASNEVSEQIKRLRSNNSSLENSLSKAQDNVSTLIASEKELKSKLRKTGKAFVSLEKEHKEMRTMLENTKGNVSQLQSEKSRQVRYLEQENLQLMQELKSLKRSFKATKSELNSYKQGMMTTSNNDELPHPSSHSQQVQQEVVLSTSNSTSKTKVSSPKRERERELDFLNESPFASLEESRRSSMGSASATAKETDISVAVDKTVDEDNTAECKQS